MVCQAGWCGSQQAAANVDTAGIGRQMRDSARWGAIAMTCVVLGTGCTSPAQEAGGFGKSASPSKSAAAADVLRTTEAPWDRPTDQASLVERAGLTLFPQEHLDVHYHAKLKVVVHGDQVPVPGGLGINQGDNGQPPAHGEPGIAPLHTHEADGVLHVEAARDDTFTLGQVFILWGVLLEPGRVGAYSADHGKKHQVVVLVDGEKTTGDPNDLVLRPEQEIAVVVGEGESAVDVA